MAETGSEIKLGTVYWDLEVRSAALQAAGPQVQAASAQMTAATEKTAVALGAATAAATKTAGAMTQEAAATVKAAAAQREHAAAASATAGAIGQSKTALLEHALAADRTHQALRQAEGALTQLAIGAAGANLPMGRLSESLLLFSGGTGAILGVAAAVAVVAKGYDLITESARKAKEAADAAAAAIKARDVVPEAATTLQNINDLAEDRRRLEDQLADTKRQIALFRNPHGLETQTLRTQADDLQRQIDERSREIAAGQQQFRDQHAQTIAEQTKKATDATRRLEDLRSAAEAAAAAITKGLGDDAVAALRRFDLETQRLEQDDPAHAATIAAARARARLQPLANVSAAQTKDYIAAQLGTLPTLGATPGVADLYGRQRAVQGVAQTLGDRLALLQFTNQQGVNDQAIYDLESKLRDLDKERLDLVKQRTDLLRSQVDDIDRRSAEVGAQLIQGLSKDPIVGQAALEKSRQATADLARNIVDATRGALQLASAFGVVDDQTSKVLSGIAQAAGTIPKLLSDIRTLGKDQGATVTDLIGSSLSVVGGIAAVVTGLFGESPAEKARQQELAKNTAAIQKLTETVGELGLPGVTGRQFAAASRAATELTPAELLHYGQGALGVQGGKLDAELARLGTSRADLQAIANALGLSVDFTTSNMVDLQHAFDALNKAIKATELTQFAQTFAGQMQALQAQFQLFDIKDPIAQLKLMAQVAGEVKTSGPTAEDLAKKLGRAFTDLPQALQDQLVKSLQSTTQIGSPALAEAFAGIDLGTAEGRAQAEHNLQALFLQLQAGTLAPDQLGGLTGDEFLKELTDLKTAIDNANGASANGQTNNYAVQRTVTEVTAEQMAGLLVSIDARLAEANGYLAQLAAQAIAAYRVTSPGLSPPPLPSGVGGGSASAGAGAVILQAGAIVVQIGAGADPAMAAAAGTAAGTAFVNKILGAKLRQARVWQGDPVRSA